MTTIGIDLDGTLINYGFTPGHTARINKPLVKGLPATMRQYGADGVAIITNQGGLAWGLKGSSRGNGTPFPTPSDFINRLFAAVNFLRLSRIYVASVYVCTYHPDAQERLIQLAASQVRQSVKLMVAGGAIGKGVVYAMSQARKPAPMMLLQAKAAVYLGDSPEDAAAARNAGIDFVEVRRFV